MIITKTSSHHRTLTPIVSYLQLLLLISLSLRLTTASPLSSSSSLSLSRSLSARSSAASDDYAVSCRLHTSLYCPFFWNPSFLYLNDIQSALWTINPDVRYPKGLPYVCLEYWGDGEGYCVFTEGDGVPEDGLTVGEVRERVNEMKRKGCWACGVVGWDVPVNDVVVVEGQAGEDRDGDGEGQRGGPGVEGKEKVKRAFVKIDWVGKPDRCARDVGSGYVCEIVVINGVEKVDAMRS